MNAEPNEIHFECPKCNRHLSGDKSLLGQQINCPDCNIQFVVALPKPESKSATESEPTANKSQIEIECSRCLTRWFIKQIKLNEFVTCPSCQKQFYPSPSRDHEQKPALMPLPQTSGITVGLRIFAVLNLLGAVIGGLSYADKDGSIAFLIFSGGCLGGLILLGFAEIVNHTSQTAKRLERIEILINRKFPDRTVK